MAEILGLSTERAKQLLAEHGENVTRADKPKSKLRLLLKQFESPIILILIAATIISMGLGEIIDGLIILGILIPSGFLNYWQENRANQTMQTLLKQLEITIEVMRDGESTSVPIRLLVPGDAIRLYTGDLVPADCTLLESQNLSVDESALTGETFSVEKTPDGDNELHFGTHLASGSGIATITATGMQTKYGELVSDLAQRDTKTGFERGTAAFGLMLMRAILALGSALVIFNVIMQRPLIDSLLFSLALAVGLTPQLLPTIITVSLASGARVMAKNRVLVKRLDAIEDFGSMNVLCSDKTGTLTIGVTKLKTALDASGSESSAVLRLASLNAHLQSGFANPLDEQIKQAKPLERLPKKLSELAYDFERKRLSVLVALDRPTLICKGAFDSVLKVCAVASINGQQVEISKVRKELVEIYSAESNRGNRVLAVASKSTAALDESELIFEGFLIFADELKPDAAQEVIRLRELGIEFYLVTGDNALAAKYVASQVGINAEVVITGDELSKTGTTELTSMVQQARVFANVDPLQKARIVKALSKAGNTVGFFGDGINDSAAIKAADVGISVDTAVDIAKESASIVLLDHNLNVIAKGVRLGRTTFMNTMKYVKVTISANFGNVFSMAIASVFLPFLPLLPLQILLLNFLSDVPALTIATDRVDEADLAKPHAWDVKQIRRAMIAFGLVSSIFDIATFVILTQVLKADQELFRTTWFIESCLTELLAMLVLRTRFAFFKSKPGKGLTISSALVAATLFALPFAPFASALGMTSITWQIAVTVIALAALYSLLNELVKRRV